MIVGVKFSDSLGPAKEYGPGSGRLAMRWEPEVAVQRLQIVAYEFGKVEVTNWEEEAEFSVSSWSKGTYNFPELLERALDGARKLGWLP